MTGHPRQPIAPENASAILSRATFAADEVKLSPLEFLVESGAQANCELEFDKGVVRTNSRNTSGKSDVTKSSDAPNRSRPRSSEPAK